MFYPEAPYIRHLWVDVGLQRLGRHPLVRRRLVAPAPVLGHLSTLMITMIMMLMMSIVDLVRVIGSLGWCGWCYHGHGQPEVSNLVIRTVIIICWWSDFEEEFFLIVFGYNWKVGRTEWVSPKVENFGKLSDHGPRCDDDSLWKLSSNPTSTNCSPGIYDNW